MFPFISSSAYSFGERILRTSVFQIGVDKGFFEHTLMRIYNIFAQKTCFPKLFDPQKAKEGIDSFEHLGADITFVTPLDQKASIHTMHLKSRDLENKLHKLGAEWKRVEIGENEQKRGIFAIFPPENKTSKWDKMEKDLLRLKWKKREEFIDGKNQEIIVTCENADLISPEQEHRLLFLHANSASVCYSMLTRRIGYYLGMKQNVCCHDPRGTSKSEGEPSEAGYYNDIRAVYQHVKDQYSPEDIWVTAACGGCAAAAFLKAENHESGMNLILENGFSDLKRDFVDQESLLVRKFAAWFWAGLESRDIEEANKPKQTGFNIEEFWKGLKPTRKGKMIFVNVRKDQRLPPEVANRNIQLAQSICHNVLGVSFESTWKEDPHFDRYFKYADSRLQVMSYIFG